MLLYRIHQGKGEFGARIVKAQELDRSLSLGPSGLKNREGVPERLDYTEPSGILFKSGREG